jgi:hypothetical protein
LNDREYEQALCCRNLWRQVLNLALTDAMNFKEIHKAEKENSYYWIVNGQKTFRIVCDYAGYDAEFVRDRFLVAHDKKLERIKKRREKLLREGKVANGV